MQRYCQNCGTVAEPKQFTKGTFGTEVVLWLLFLIPGIFYSVWRLASRYYGCPSCGAPGMIALDSPKARAAGAHAVERPKKINKQPVERSLSYRSGKKIGLLVRRLFHAFVILLFLLTLPIYAEAAKCTTCPRDDHGRIARDRGAVRDFKRHNPKPFGCDRCQVDHIVPLSKGGSDDPSNMQWLPLDEHRDKTRRDR